MNSGLATIRSIVEQFWNRRSQRERRIVSAGLTLLLGLIIWLGIWDPVQQSREKLAQRNIKLQNELRHIQGIALAANSLPKESKASSPPDQMSVRIRTILGSQGLRLKELDVDTANLSAKAQIEGNFSACVKALDQVRRETRWALVKARFDALGEPGQVRAYLNWMQP